MRKLLKKKIFVVAICLLAALLLVAALGAAYVLGVDA